MPKRNRDTQLALPGTLDLGPDVRRLIRASKSRNTQRAYQFAWSDFEDWCRRFQSIALPAHPATIMEYLRILSEVNSVATLSVKLAAISFAHVSAHQPDPTDAPEVRTVMAGLRRTLGTAPNKKAPVTRGDLQRMVESLPDSLTGLRDRAMLLVGFAGAFRRSELVALDVKHVAFLEDRMVITLPRSKTDQEGRGAKKHLPRVGGAICPVAALQGWLVSAGIRSGPLFRKVDRWGNVGDQRLNDKTVARIIKAAAQAAGLNPDVVSGHSLRSGFITSAAGRNIAEWKIQQVSTHKSVEVLRGYIQDAGQGGLEAVREVLEG
jgi:integrase